MSTLKRSAVSTAGTNSLTDPLRLSPSAAFEVDTFGFLDCGSCAICARTTVTNLIDPTHLLGLTQGFMYWFTWVHWGIPVTWHFCLCIDTSTHARMMNSFPCGASSACWPVAQLDTARSSDLSVLFISFVLVRKGIKFQCCMCVFAWSSC